MGNTLPRVGYAKELSDKHPTTKEVHKILMKVLSTCTSWISLVCSVMDAREFEWESQLRFYWEKEPDELVIRQCTGTFGYGYEYMGLNGRLVITPLTDRIYLTLTQVIILQLWPLRFLLFASVSVFLSMSVCLPFSLSLSLSCMCFGKCNIALKVLLEERNILLLLALLTPGGVVGALY